MIHALTLTVCLMILGTSCLLTGEDERRISVSIHGQPDFGSAIKVIVEYRNDSDETWRLEDPSQATTSYMRYRPAGSTGHPSGYAMGRIEMVEIKEPVYEMAHALPDVEEIDILSRTSFVFAVDLERDWTGHLAPGIWETWFYDGAAKLSSNTALVYIPFTSKSIGHLLDDVRNKKMFRYRRKAAGKWLSRIRPEFEIEWWSSELADPEEVASKWNVIRQQLVDYEEWLTDPINAQQIESAIDAINATGLGAMPIGIESALLRLHKVGDDLSVVLDMEAPKRSWRIVLHCAGLAHVPPPLALSDDQRQAVALLKRQAEEQIKDRLVELVLSDRSIIRDGRRLLAERLLLHGHNADTVDYAEFMIRSGLAVADSQRMQSEDPDIIRYHERLQLLQREAIANRVGLWSIEPYRSALSRLSEVPDERE